VAAVFCADGQAAFSQSCLVRGRTLRGGWAARFDGGDEGVVAALGMDPAGFPFLRGVSPLLRVSFQYKIRLC